MGKSPPQDRQPAIREISVEGGGSPRTLDAPTPPTGASWWIAGLVAIAAMAGLGYGFLLGRGDRPDPPTTSGPTATTTTLRATTTTIADQFPVSSVGFVRASPGHDLGVGVTEYLNPNMYEAIDVDAAGIVWAGGPNGVVRLDPATGQFARLTGADGTGPLDIMAVKAAPDGTVWAASSRGLSHWDGEGWSHDSRFPLAYPDGRWVAGLEVGSGGEVWIATNAWRPAIDSIAQLHRLEEPFAGDMWTTTITPDIGAIRVGDDGIMWVLAGNQLWEYDDVWRAAANLGARFVQAMTIDEAGIVWVGGDRIARWDGQELSDVRWKTETQRQDDIDPLGPESWVQALASGVGDDVWAVVHTWDPVDETEISELLHFESGAITRTSLPDGSGNGAPRSLAVSPDGHVWVAAGTALLRFDGEWRAFSIEDQPPLGWVESLAGGENGELWMAVGDGILRKDGDQWQHFGLSDFGLEPDNAWEGGFWVVSSSDGSIWGGVGCRAYRLAGEEWAALPPVPDRPDDCWDVRATIDPEESLWMSPGCCSIPTPVYRWSGGDWEVVATAGQIFDVAFGDSGDLWMIDPSGIKRFTDGLWTPLLSGVSVREITVSGGGEVWAAGEEWSAEGLPTGGILWNYDGDAWTLTQQGEAIHSLTRGPTGEVWALQARRNGGTSLFEVATGRARFVTDSPTSRTMAIAEDGTAWIGGYGRLYRVDPID